MTVTSSTPPPGKRQPSAGFSLVEMMVSVGIFLGFLVAAMVAVQLYGLRVYTLAATKITATAQARTVLNQIRENIRSATNVWVGNYSNSVFSSIPLGTNQTGNALQVFLPANGGAPLTYYVDETTSPTNLWMIDQNSNKVALLNYMTNVNCFAAQDCFGTNLFVFKNCPVVCVTFNFVQWEFPLAAVTNTGALDAYDYYRLQTRVSERF
jgi:type II secretory pathway pseudopilin PulG